MNRFGICEIPEQVSVDGSFSNFFVVLVEGYEMKFGLLQGPQPPMDCTRHVSFGSL